MMVGFAACQLPSSSPSQGGSANLSAHLDLCAAEINRYRQMAGRPPLVRSDSLEQFAAESAAHDAAAGVPHQFFSATNGGHGTARAETQLLRWRGYAVAEVIRRGLAQMWAAGPGGTHYAVMLGEYTEVGCGIFVEGREVSVSQAYR